MPSYRLSEGSCCGKPGPRLLIILRFRRPSGVPVSASAADAAPTLCFGNAWQNALAL